MAGERDHIGAVSGSVAFHGRPACSRTPRSWFPALQPIVVIVIQRTAARRQNAPRQIDIVPSRVSGRLPQPPIISPHCGGSREISIAGHAGLKPRFRSGKFLRRLADSCTKANTTYGCHGHSVTSFGAGDLDDRHLRKGAVGQSRGMTAFRIGGRVLL